MDSDIDGGSVSIAGTLTDFRLAESKTVRELLKELGLLYRHFVVLVDGKRAFLEDEIQEGQRVIVLPIVAGG